MIEEEEKPLWDKQQLEQLKSLMNEVVNVRAFRPDPIPDEVKEELLDAFRLGPSSANIQPWEIVLVDGAEMRQQVIETTLDLLLTPTSGGGQAWVAQAPFLAVLCLDRTRAEARMGAAGFVSSVGDAYAALQNLRLTANALGLRTATVKEIDPSRLAQVLGLPWTVEPIALIAAGYSDAVIEIPPRFTLKDFVHREGWK
jgi:nitroreductase